MPVAFTAGFWRNRRTPPGSERSPLPTAHLEGRGLIPSRMRDNGAPQVLWTALDTLPSILKGAGHWVTACSHHPESAGLTEGRVAF